MSHLVGVAEVAEILGVSRQRVDQIASTYDDFPEPEAELSAGRIWSRSAIETWIALHPERGPGVGADERARFFGRFAEDARRVILAAHGEAGARGTGSMEPAHLLMGLLSPGSNEQARDALESVDVTLDDVREALGGDPPDGPDDTPPSEVRGIAFSPAAKTVLEHAFRSAQREVGSLSTIGSIDILLALLGVEPGEMERFGIGPSERREILKRCGHLERARSIAFTPSDALRLTHREAEVVEHLLRDLSTDEIASSLSVTTTTVRQHLRNIGEKLVLRTQATDEPQEESAEGPLDLVGELRRISERLDSIERRLAG